MGAHYTNGRRQTISGDDFCYALQLTGIRLWPLLQAVTLRPGILALCKHSTCLHAYRPRQYALLCMPDFAVRHNLFVQRVLFDCWKGSMPCTWSTTFFDNDPELAAGDIATQLAFDQRDELACAPLFSIGYSTLAWLLQAPTRYGWNHTVPGWWHAMVLLA